MIYDVENKVEDMAKDFVAEFPFLRKLETKDRDILKARLAGLLQDTYEEGEDDGRVQGQEAGYEEGYSAGFDDAGSGEEAA